MNKSPVMRRVLVDRLAGADPSRVVRRWTVPTWMLSVLLHAGLLLAALWTIPRLARGLPQPVDPEAREVGIVLKSEQDAEVVFENAEQVMKPTPTEDPVALDEAEEWIEAPRRDSAPAPLPHLDTSLLATAGSTPTPSANQLPRFQQSPGGPTSRTTFWDVEAVGASFVFVIDRSASMSSRGALDLAKTQLFQSLEQLNPESTFQVIFYNTESFMLSMGDGSLIEASQIHRSRARKEIERVTPEGGTNHVKPLALAFSLRPEVIYYLTDADMLSDEDVADLTRMNRKASRPATVFAIEFGNGPNLSRNKPLRRLAADNDGTYTYLNVLDFGSSIAQPK